MILLIVISPLHPGRRAHSPPQRGVARAGLDAFVGDLYCIITIMITTSITTMSLYVDYHCCCAGIIIVTSYSSSQNCLHFSIRRGQASPALDAQVGDGLGRNNSNTTTTNNNNNTIKITIIIIIMILIIIIVIIL